MARVTLQDIRERAHALAQVPQESSGRTSALASKAAVTSEINAALGELHNILVNANQDYMTEYMTFDIAADDDKYLLPEDFYKLRSLVAQVSTNERRPLEEWQILDQSRYRVNEAWDYPDYRIMGRYIRWLPIPRIARTIEMYYVRQWLPLENESDELPPEIARGWEDFLVGHAAMWLLKTLSLDWTKAREMKEESREMIKDAAEKRNSYQPRKTPDVNRRYHGYRRYRYPWPQR